jgi:hypothetical protein
VVLEGTECDPLGDQFARPGLGRKGRWQLFLMDADERLGFVGDLIRQPGSEPLGVAACTTRCTSSRRSSQ